MRFGKRRPPAIVDDRPEARYPHLANAFGCWFHQDWPADAEARGAPAVPESAVAQLFEDVPAAYVVELKRDLVLLAASGCDAAVIRTMIDESFHGYLPSMSDGAFRDWWRWFSEVADARLRTHGVDPDDGAFAVESVLRSVPGPIEGPRLCVVADSGEIVGRVLRRGDDEPIDTTKALAVLVKDDSPDGYRVHTSYPVL